MTVAVEQLAAEADRSDQWVGGERFPRTLSGTWYLLDLSRPSGPVVSRVIDPGNATPDHALRRDGETLALLAASPILLGMNWVQVLDLRGDGLVTVRSTNLVTSARRLEASEV